MLDNALDISAYPSQTAKNTAHQYRPLALGVCGFQELLHRLKISYASAGAVDWADRSMESVAYFAALASSALAQERGPYANFESSKWRLGLFSQDTLGLLEGELGEPIEVDRSSHHDWALLRQQVLTHGLRNCATTALGPMSEGAVLAGVTPSAEPVKCLAQADTDSTQSGQWNSCLVNELQSRNLWTPALANLLLQSGGSVQQLDAIPPDLKEVYRTAFEIDPRWLIECAARRQKWLDMGQALTLYLSLTDFTALSELFFLAWRKGLKATRHALAPAAGPKFKQSSSRSHALARPTP
jgi:ribonucleoside-diphosphate reductase alpha chain